MMSQPSVTRVEKRKIRQLMLKENKIKIRLAYKDARTLEKDGGGPLFALATTYYYYRMDDDAWAHRKKHVQ